MKAKIKPEPQYITVAGHRAVVLPEAEYRRLATLAGEWEPSLPAPDADGNYPADTTLAALVARKIVRRRRAVGLSQAELARRAGIRPETLNRIEHGEHAPSIATVEKLDRALRAAEAEDKD
jgi:ribosome-binding protein aMBF1 (putative translation factor)